MRLLAFTDYIYRRVDGAVYAERAFALFLAALAERVDSLTIVGRLDMGDGPAHYRLPPTVRFVALPHYPSLMRPGGVLRSLIRSTGRFWRALDDADRVLVLGPQPHAVLLAGISRLRRRPLVLGVRQDFPQYVRSRRPSQRWAHRSADILERAWRQLARRVPVAAVGPELEQQYRHSPATHQLTVSLITSSDVEAGRAAALRDYSGDLQLLSVGRIDKEKNPGLLVEVLSRLRAEDPRWRLVVCGEGPLTPELARAVDESGLGENVRLVGYVPVQDGLLDLYRESHAFLHVSLTEGMPQVLIEAFGSGLPTVATAVGGVPGAVGAAALLVPPNDPIAATAALQRVASSRELRERLTAAGFEIAGRHTLDSEADRLASFIAHSGDHD